MNLMKIMDFFWMEDKGVWLSLMVKVMKFRLLVYNFYWIKEKV